MKLSYNRNSKNPIYYISQSIRNGKKTTSFNVCKIGKHSELLAQGIENPLEYAKNQVKKYNNYQLLNNLKKTCKGKNTLVILMHDTKDVSNSSNVLKESIQYLKSQGYTFKNFYDIL